MKLFAKCKIYVRVKIKNPANKRGVVSVFPFVDSNHDRNFQRVMC